MSKENETSQPGPADAGDPAAGGTPPPAGTQPAQNFVTNDQLNAALVKLGDTLTSSFQALADARSVPLGHTVDDKDDPDPSIDEIVTEIRDEGKGAKLQKLLTNLTARVEKKQIAPLRAFGVESLSKLSKAVALQSGKMPHYARFQKEIDALIANVAKINPGDLANPETYFNAHSFVCGANMAALLKDEREAAVRSGREGDGGNTPGQGNGRSAGAAGAGAGKVPTVEEFAGPEAAKALQEQGRTPDQFAQKLGYKNWPDYYEKTKDLEAIAAGKPPVGGK